MDIRHFATWWETVADAFGDRPALSHGDLRRTWSELDDRSARLAAAFAEAGVGFESKVALYLYNGPEYLEAHFAAYKLRGISVNVNYRYLDDELAYLIADSEAEVLVYHRSLGDRVARVRDRLPGVRLLVEVDDGEGSSVDGAADYEALIREHEPAPRIDRSPDDKTMLYTGGTTGLPKGVVTTHGVQIPGIMDGAFALVGSTTPSDEVELVERLQLIESSLGRQVGLPACPLMHATGLWLGAAITLCSGGEVVTLPNRSFDAHELWETVEQKGVTGIVLVGDAFGRPLVRALEARASAGAPYDTSSLTRIISSGAMLSAETRHALLRHVPQLMIIDVLGSTETSIGMQVVMAGAEPETGVFTPFPATKVLTEEGREVAPGSGEQGMLAVASPTTRGYFKDEAKTASLLREIDGVTYAVTGDYASVEADGKIRLLGRGSQSINTGGEKVFPEEVEEAVKRVEGIDDCLVVGLPDERFGERVVAVASKGAESPLTPADIIAAVRTDLAAFKAPKDVVFVPTVPRAPNGKADYKTARSLAQGAAGHG